MPWPTSSDYNEAMQNLATSVADEELRAGVPERNALGLPAPYAGNFADVYRVNCPATGNSWAVKCFTREVTDLRDRYRAISEHMGRVKLPFMTDFYYLEEGLRISGRWYPIVKMRWVEGIGLNRFVAEHLDQPRVLRQLGELWVKLAHRLEEAEIAHADLQHGNVLLVPEAKGLRLTLIDYDGMYVPALAGRGSGERGHPAYQHPERLRNGTHDATVDRFSHLAIYTALQCLAADASLWQKYDNRENLLFRLSDFAKPGESELLRQLWQSHSDSSVNNLIGWLILATQAPLQSMPRFKDIVTNGYVAPLMPVERRRISEIMHPGIVNVATFDKDRSSIEPSATENAADLLQLTAPRGRQLCELTGRHTAVNAVAFGPKGRLIVTGGWDGEIIFWDTMSGEVLDEHKVHIGSVNAVAVRSDGLQIVTGSADKTAILWDVRTQAIRQRFKGHRGFVTAVAFSPKGMNVLTGSRDGTAILWNATTGERLHTYMGHDSAVTSVAFSPDGTQILTGSHDYTAVLWDIDSEQPLRKFVRHTRFVAAVSFSPDGRQLLTGSWDNTAILWNVTDGTAPLRILRGHDAAVTSVAFNSDGRRILTGSWDHTAILWDSDTAEELRRFIGHDDWISSVAFSFDDQEIVTASEDGSAIVWKSGLECISAWSAIKRLLARPPNRDIVAISRFLVALYAAIVQLVIQCCRSSVRTGDRVFGAVAGFENSLLHNARRVVVPTFCASVLSYCMVHPSQSPPSTARPPSAAVAPFDAAAARAHQEAWAEYLGIAVQATNSLGMKLALIPAGEFMMGSNDAVDERPVHRARITKPFYFGQTEVTQSHWQAVMETKPWSGKTNVREGADCPATYVSWEDAIEFCQKLSAKEGLAYDLPTEAQWEYACRAGTTTTYHFGDADSQLGEYAWYSKVDFFLALERHAHAVGQKRANAWGLYDLHGNVSEWCRDWYGDKYYGEAMADDPTGGAAGSHRVYRGGCWDNEPATCRSAKRGSNTPDFRGAGLGFRVALVP